MVAVKADDGVSVAVAPETLMDAATSDDAPAARNLKVAAVNVDPFMPRSNVTPTLVLVETPVAPAAGDRPTITGDVGADAVVNVQLAVLPSVTPLVSATLLATVAV